MSVLAQWKVFDILRRSIVPIALMTFLILYLGMFWLAWPLAVRFAEAYVPGVKSSS